MPEPDVAGVSEEDEDQGPSATKTIGNVKTLREIALLKSE